MRVQCVFSLFWDQSKNCAQDDPRVVFSVLFGCIQDLRCESQPGKTSVWLMRQRLSMIHCQVWQFGERNRTFRFFPRSWDPWTKQLWQMIPLPFLHHLAATCANSLLVLQSGCCGDCFQSLNGKTNSWRCGETDFANVVFHSHQNPGEDWNCQVSTVWSVTALTCCQDPWLDSCNACKWKQFPCCVRLMPATEFVMLLCVTHNKCNSKSSSPFHGNFWKIVVRWHCWWKDSNAASRPLCKFSTPSIPSVLFFANVFMCDASGWK